jgi:hypothetical protein
LARALIRRIAAMPDCACSHADRISHVANKGESFGMEVRYYRYYPAGGICRGKRKEQNQDGLIRCVLKPEEDSKACRKNRARSKIRRWPRLVQKIGACSLLDRGRRIPSYVPDATVECAS